MKVDGSLKSLLQGVSQQPPRDRIPGQCTAQINMSADPVEGLGRRAPTDLIGNIGTATNLQGFYEFTTKNGGKFIAFFHDNTVQVVDYNGVQQTVTLSPSASLYLSTAGKLVFATLQNQVVISNTGITPAMTGAFKPYANKGTGSKPMGLIQVLGGQYGRQYKVFVNGTLAAMYMTPDGSNAASSIFTRTTFIAERLANAMTNPGGLTGPDGDGAYTNRTNLLGGPNWTVTVSGDIILIVNNTGSDFTLTTSDDSGNINMKSLTDQVPDIADLPELAPHGYVARVATETDPEEDIYLEFRINGYTSGTVLGSNFGVEGYWQETISPTAEYLLDLGTMPHILEYDPATGVFAMKRNLWKERLVGTDVSNPKPSFIGNPIQDISTFQSRLVFLAGAFVSMSRTNRYTDFWMGSASQLVDSDPIDISSTAPEARVMLAAVPHNRDLVIFSKKGQFIVFGRSAVTPANAALVLTTSFEAELNAKPVPAGRNVFFATNYGRFTGIREFFTEGGSEINDTRPVTQHIKKYIKGRAEKMSTSSNYDTLIVQTEDDRTTLSIYQFIWDDLKKIQSAWSQWKFPHEVVYSFFDEELVYLILRFEGTYFMYRMSLDVYETDSVPYAIYLDSRFDVPNCFTSFILPAARLRLNELVAVQGEGCPYPGLTNPIESITSNGSAWVVTLKYNMNGGNVIMGVRYNEGSRYRPTMPMVKDADGVVVGTGKLRVKGFICSMENTGDVNGIVLSPFGDSDVVEYQARIVGDLDNVIGEVALSDEDFYLPFREKTDAAEIELFTLSHLPMNILDIEYVGQYTKRGRRINSGG